MINSAVGLSLLLLPNYTTIAFGTIFFVTIFRFSRSDANALFNWIWAFHAVALIVAGILFDCLSVSKPFMLVASLGPGDPAGVPAGFTGHWQLWWRFRAAGMLVFAGTIFLMRGRWSPAASKADIEAHDRAVAREMARLAAAPGAG